MDKRRSVLKIPKWLWFWNKKTKKKNSERRTFFRRSSSFFVAEKGYFPDTGIKAWDGIEKACQRGISLYNDSDYNMKKENGQEIGKFQYNRRRRIYA